MPPPAMITSGALRLLGCWWATIDGLVPSTLAAGASHVAPAGWRKPTHAAASEASHMAPTLDHSLRSPRQALVLRKIFHKGQFSPF